VEQLYVGVNLRLKVENTLGTLAGRVVCTLQHVQTKKKIRKVYDNLVVTAAKSMIMQRLGGGGNNCDITYGAVGTDGTAPAVGQTTLVTELARKIATSRSYTPTTVTITIFFGASEAVGTLLEFALFGEAASATPNSGTMFDRALISVVKTAAYTLTIEATITIS